MTRTATQPITLTLLVVLAVAVGGCGLHDPYQNTTTTTTAKRATTPTATGPRIVDNEVQPTHPRHNPKQRLATAPAPSATTAIQRFAALYVNWTYRTIAEHRRALAAMAVGDAAAAQRRGAAQVQSDGELRIGKVENHGKIVSVARDRTARSADRYVVVTRETTTGEGTYQGLPAGYHVTLATAARVSGGFAVSDWEPQT
jgi:hypothetical protein